MPRIAYMRVLSSKPQILVALKNTKYSSMEMEMEMEESNSSRSSSSRNQWTSGERLKKFSRLLLDSIKDFFEWISPTFFCATIFVTFLETYLPHYWKIGVTSNILVRLGSKYSIYSIVFPVGQEIPQRITLNLSTFVSLIFADLPYVLAYIDLELCPSFSTARGLISLAICCLTVADIYVFNMRTRLLGWQLYSQLYWQSYLRFLVFVGLIVAGTSNMIEKAWRGDLVFHKHVLILLSICVFAFIRFREPCRRLRRMGKKAMTVVPVVEEEKED